MVGTYGRGFWIMDDLTPLQQLTPEVARVGGAPLLSARHVSVPADHPADDDARRPSAGEDPPYGASINYWLSKAPEGNVKIRIENQKGETVRSLDGTKEAGVNRIHWNLEESPRPRSSSG